MNAQQKVVQYLNEAQASEHTALRALQSQIAMTPTGEYRTAIEQHLRETRGHADRVGRRISELDGSSNPVFAVAGVAASLVGQTIALSKAPLDLLRGSGGEEKILKNAKDTCATEALEVATYTALERVARDVGDTTTAELAASILEDEQRMLDRVVDLIPALAAAVVDADVDGVSTFDASTTGAAQAFDRAARSVRKVPGVTHVEGEVKGAFASAEDLPIDGYDDLTAKEITDRLSGLSQIDLGKLDAYERKNDARTTVLDRIDSLRGDEPWPGYDELTVGEVTKVLDAADDDTVNKTRTYERSHKDRAGVLNAADRVLAST